MHFTNLLDLGLARTATRTLLASMITTGAPESVAARLLNPMYYVRKMACGRPAGF